VRFGDFLTNETSSPRTVLSFFKRRTSAQGGQYHVALTVSLKYIALLDALVVDSATCLLTKTIEEEDL